MIKIIRNWLEAIKEYTTVKNDRDTFEKELADKTDELIVCSRLLVRVQNELGKLKEAKNQKPQEEKIK